jgi:Family of unknown function (DUF6114)
VSYPGDRYDGSGEPAQWTEPGPTAAGGPDEEPPAPAPDRTELMADLMAMGPVSDEEQAGADEVRPGGLRRGWRAFRAWRRSRPFWGALQIMIGGTEIFLTGLSPLKVIVHLGLEGLAGQAIPILMIVCGALLLISPDQRLFYGVIAFLASAGSWITSNLGGFIIGMVFGLIGASMAIAWGPVMGIEGQRTRRRRRRRAA